MPDATRHDDPPVALPAFHVHRVVARPRNRHLRALEERLGWAGKRLRLPLVWRLTEGEGVKVAVLDTGIDRDHPDLAEAVEEVRDFTGEGVEDGNGHGTHVAGIVAARRNGRGFAGVAPRCRLLVGKVLRDAGGGTHAWIAAGIDWAVERGADIISMSLGSAHDSPELFGAVHRALAAGRILICAAGNDGALFANGIGYPGRYGSVITVAAHDRNGNPAGFSSRGGEIDVMAPGERIWSTWKDGGYAELSGTSMATPFVAGLAALVLAKHRKPGYHRTPVRNCEEMRAHLLRLAAHPGHHDEARGYGPLLPFRMIGEPA